VRWYLRYKLSLRDLVEMMAERGLDIAHTTIMRWVQRYVPQFEKRWNDYARKSGRSWRVDETYLKVSVPIRSSFSFERIPMEGRC
jgi:transposase-like protein